MPAFPKGGMRHGQAGRIIGQRVGARSGTCDEVSNFQQTTGTIPVSFSLGGPKHAALWGNETEWDKLKGSVKTALTTIAGPAAELVDVFGVADLQGDVYFQASVVSQEIAGMPCQIQASIVKAFQDGALHVLLRVTIGTCSMAAGRCWPRLVRVCPMPSQYHIRSNLAPALAKPRST